MGINKLLKELHYLSIGIAEARITLADIKVNSGEKWEFDNVALTLFGANTNIETAIDNLYRMAEGRKLRDDIKTPPFTDAQKQVIQDTVKLNEKCNKIDSEVNKWGRKRICDVDDDL